ncbi:UDP-glucose 4-epimerase GalE [Nitrospirillum iridis]|uniref:UDP-glucose 4-epimerase n=1 Tax=Nitrospirillum iridis TaxID=765888 RepID=A0A7X0AW59_9PROT|nr:UDP-glucose 4-epimerase GalE [Nitrospirillum iridis]MBB6249789.1 UDP-arabinose 4-epimerase [Nitrospirillum iridis]
MPALPHSPAMARVRSVLVTGGAGYIGSHTCKALARAGYLPVTYDSLQTGHADAVRWGPLVRGDIRDAATLAGTIAEYGPVAVMHFAASAYVADSIADPAAYYDNNVAGSLCLLNAMRAVGLDALVFSSSCATYGPVDTLPVTEETPQRPVSPYGRTKLMVEHILEDYGRAYGLRSAALRYFNAAGADPDGEIGERHDPEPHLLPRALLVALGRLPHLAINGDDYDTPDGTCLRDFVHVSDLARGHVLALEHLLRGGPSLRLNLGTGRATSIRDLVRAVERVSGRPVPCQISPRRPGDPPAVYAAPDKARAILGFTTAFNDIDAIAATAWRFLLTSAASHAQPPEERQA